MRHADQKYIDALLNNDSVVLEELYKRFSGKIKCMVMDNNGCETDAADIFQDALLTIYSNAKKKEFILTCPFEAFLFLICKSKWINELNSRKCHKVTFCETDGYNIGEDSFAITQERALQTARKELLAQTLDQLDEGSKRLLWLNWSGKSMGEVSRILNLTYGYARKKKSECVAKLVTLVKQSSKFNSLKR